MDKPDVKADNGTLSMEKPTDEDVEESTIGNQNEASTSPPEAKTENPQSAPQEFQFTSSRRNQSPPRSAQSEPRHSPSPVNNSLIPAGAIKTPPDSSDDDEERGRSIESLSALQEAIQQIPVNRQSIARPRRPRSNYGPPLVTHDNANPAIPSARYPNPQQNAQQEQWKDVTLQKIIETKRYGTDSSEYESSSEEEHIPRRPLRPPNPAGQQTMPPPRPQFGHGPIARETRGKAALSLPEVSSRRATEATSRSTGVYRGTQSARMAPSRSIGVYRGTQSARVASDYDTSRGRVIVENPRRATEATSRSTRVYRGTQSARMAPSRSIGVYRGTQSARPASDYDTSRGRVIVESPRISRRQSYQKVEKNYPNEPVVPSRRRRLALHEHVNDTTDGEIRLRVDASAPLSLSFDGEMEGRTLQIEPVEGGMADLIITPRRENGDDSSTRAYDGDAEGSKGLSEKPKKPLQRRGSVSSKPRATRRQIIVEPNQSRLRTSSSTNRPTIYYDPHEYESGYYMPGMPEPVYPTPPQERGPPPSMSAHYHSLPPQPYHHPLPPDTIANSLPTLPQQPRRMAWSEGSDRAHWYNPPIHVHQAPEPVAMHSSSNISIAQGTPAVQGRPTTGAGSPDSRTLPYQHRHQPSLMESAVQPPSSLPPTQVQPPPPVPSAPKPPAAEPRKSNLMSLLNDDQPEEPKRKKPIEQTIPSHTPTPQQQTSIAPPPPVSQALPPRRDPYVEATTQPPYGRIPYAQQPGVAQMPGRQVVDLTRVSNDSLLEPDRDEETIESRVARIKTRVAELTGNVDGQSERTSDMGRSPMSHREADTILRKSILRKPTEKFPENPGHIREGVSAHKTSLNKEVPPDARWTKIDRRLVNPEALVQGKERFEERLDCVVVLRVLTKEEIQKYADRTKKIRDERETKEEAVLDREAEPQIEEPSESYSTPVPKLPHKAEPLQSELGAHKKTFNSEEDDDGNPPFVIRVPIPASGLNDDGNLFTGQAFEPTVIEDDTLSVISSYADSVFSVESLVSAGTDFSRNSGFSADEITTATKRLIAIFQDDTVLKPLYHQALDDPAIGSAKLERNLRRLFKHCAHDLEKEAKDRLEYLGARLVSFQARPLARSIVSRFGGSSSAPTIPNPGDESEDSSDDDEQPQTFDDAVFEDLATFSTFLVQSEAFQLLRESVAKFASPKRSQNSTERPAMAVSFLSDDPLLSDPEKDLEKSTQGNMNGRDKFENLQDDLLETESAGIDENFSYTDPTSMYRDTEPVWRRPRSKSIDYDVQGMVGKENYVKRLQSYYAANQSREEAAQFAWKALIENPVKMSLQGKIGPLSMGFERGRRNSDGAFVGLKDSAIWETPSQSSPSRPVPRRVQLRFKCRCSRIFTCDVVELRERGIEDLVNRMQRSIGSHVTVTPSSTTSSNSGKQSFQQLPSQFQNISVKFKSIFQRQAQQQQAPAVSILPIANTNTSQQRILRLLACMRASRFRKSLSQDPIERVTSDRDLFVFLRERFALHRGRVKRFFTLNGVTHIFFVKFRLPLNGCVEVPRRPTTCSSSSCTCIPPPNRVGPQAEYDCTPVPAGTCPPVDPEYMAHMFNEPSCASDNDSWILDQLPKRAHGELSGEPRKPVDGWGIYYEEGWDKEPIALCVLLVFVIASLIFGVLWSHFKMDIQGAFGVSAYMVTACGIFVSFVAVKVEKS